MRRGEGIETREVSPTGILHRAYLCSSGAPAPERVRIRRFCFFTVARGPVPRDLSAHDNPNEGQALALR